MALFDRSDANSYRSAIVIKLYLVPFSSYLTLNNIVTLKSAGLVVTQVHCKRTSNLAYLVDLAVTSYLGHFKNS